MQDGELEKNKPPFSKLQTCVLTMLHKTLETMLLWCLIDTLKHQQQKAITTMKEHKLLKFDLRFIWMQLQHLLLRRTCLWAIYETNKISSTCFLKTWQTWVSELFMYLMILIFWLHEQPYNVAKRSKLLGRTLVFLYCYDTMLTKICTSSFSNLNTGDGTFSI